MLGVTRDVNSFHVMLILLATGELRPHTKQSGGSHISTTTWLCKVSMPSIYYHHFLAAGKLGSIDSNKT